MLLLQELVGLGDGGAEKVFRDTHDLCLRSPCLPLPIKHTSVFIAHLKCPSVQYLSRFLHDTDNDTHVVHYVIP